MGGYVGGGMLVNAARTSAEDRVERSRRLPREVWVASISQNNLTARDPEEMTGKLLERMTEIVPLEPDIICLPEVGPFVNLESGRISAERAAETAPGPITERFSQFARRHNCYVWCPMYTIDDGRIYNALVLIDRKGKAVGEYRKIHPTPGEIEGGIVPGPLDAPVFRTDFGVIGAQICFDIEWLDGWRSLKDKGAEIVFWSSAFGGGRKLNLLANLFRYPVVSSTRKGVTSICEMSGDTIAWTGIWETWVCAPVNLERIFLHSWPHTGKFNDIRKKYGRAIQFTTYHDEEWSIMESVSPEVRVADVLREFEIQTYDEMVREGTAVQIKHRPS
jgi:predicted amidohydrolase